MSMQLPGFTPPDAPKDESRAFATPGGMIELVLKKNVPLGESMPNYEVLISTEYGREVLFQVQVGTGHIFTERDEDGNTKRFVLRVGPPEVLFAPTTYTVRAMVNGKEVYFKTVTVQNHPALP